MSKQQGDNGAKACKHNPGDDWKDGCCGDDAVAQTTQDLIQQAESEMDSQDSAALLAGYCSEKELFPGIANPSINTQQLLKS